MMALYSTNTVLLRQIMIGRGYNTIAALADDTGLNKDTVARVLRGEGNPQASVMHAIAGVLNMSSEQCGLVFFASPIT